jgi:hypothetical protein
LLLLLLLLLPLLLLLCVYLQPPASCSRMERQTGVLRMQVLSGAGACAYVHQRAMTPSRGDWSAGSCPTWCHERCQQ